MSEPWYVRVDDISPDPHNPRKSFNSEDLADLAQSIKTYGLVQPLVLREAVPEDKASTKYVLVAGERRWRACVMLKWEEVTCTLLAEVTVGKKNTKASLAARREIPVQATAELALVENIQRQNLTPIEEARAFDRMLRTETTLNAATLSQRLGLTAEYIRLRLRLLELPEETQNLIGASKLPMQHANILHALVGNVPENRIDAVALDAARKRLPAKALERIVRGMLDREPRKKHTREDISEAAGKSSTRAAAVSAPSAMPSWQGMAKGLPALGHAPHQLVSARTQDNLGGFVFAARDPELVMRAWELVSELVSPDTTEGDSWDV